MILHHYLNWPAVKSFLPVGLAGVSAGVLAADELPGLEGAPRWVKTLVIVLTVLSCIAAFFRHMRRLIKDSDDKTENVVAQSKAAITTDLAGALRKEMAILRQEQSEREKRDSGVTSQLAGISNRLREQGDVHGELQGMAFQMGEMDNRVKKTERDLNALHAWKREVEPWRDQADALLKLWKEEVRKRKISAMDDQDTPPTGTPVPT